MGAERTKGPWEVDRGYRDAWINNGHTTIPDDHLTIYCGDEAIENFDPEKHNYIEVRGPDQEANAAFIVRAANSHEELVAALKAAEQRWCRESELPGAIDGLDHEVRTKIRAAIQLATA